MQRKIFPQLLNLCENNKILLLVWARQVGKTTLMKQLQEHLQASGEATYFLSMEKYSVLKQLNENPEQLFSIIPPISSQTYVFIDEVQYLDDPTNFLKYLYDEYHDNIKLIVSGSSSFYIDKKFKDSLVGRKQLHHIKSFDFEEVLMANDQQELIPYLQSWSVPGMYEDALRNYYEEFITYGGYPQVVLSETVQEKKEILTELADDYIRKDVVDADVKYEDIYFKIIKILANQVGSLVNAQQLSNTLDMSLPTVKRYLYIMQKSFHIGLLNPYYNNPKKELKKMPKVYFLDMWLKNHFQRNFESSSERVDIGSHLENVAYRQLLEKHSHTAIKFRRDRQKHEVDFVLDDAPAPYALEVKTNIKKFAPKKYRAFIESYPDISLTPIDLEQSMFLPYGNHG